MRGMALPFSSLSPEERQVYEKGVRWNLPSHVHVRPRTKGIMAVGCSLDQRAQPAQVQLLAADAPPFREPDIARGGLVWGGADAIPRDRFHHNIDNWWNKRDSDSHLPAPGLQHVDPSGQDPIRLHILRRNGKPTARPNLPLLQSHSLRQFSKPAAKAGS